VTVEHSGVRAVTGEGETFHVAFADCQLELGGASERMWFCRSSDRSVTIFCEAPGFAAALREAARRELGPQIAAIALHERGASKKLRLTVMITSLLIGAVLLALYLGFQALGKGVLPLVPRAVDKQVGELAREHMPLEGSVSNDPVLTKAVDEIVKRLAERTDNSFEFDVRVVDAPVLNAFALPGGPIVVYTGLLRAAESPEQVAGVLAHEIAHVTRRHGMQRIVQSLGVVAVVQLLFGDVSGVAAIAVELLREGAINSYSRDHEREADMTGVQLLHDAAIDPDGLAQFFALLEKKEGNLPAAIAWLGTHPDLSSRVREVRERERQLGPTNAKPFEFDWREVQQRAGRSEGK
jgi:predicted Zn-dependent protease